MNGKYLEESTPKLGFGFMRLPHAGAGDDAPFDYKQINKMVDYFLDAGYTYFDTAFVYGGSEEAMRETLVRRHPRDRFTIASKLNFNAAISDGKPPAPGSPPPEIPDAAECRRRLVSQFETTLARLGTDYLDFYLLHGLGGPGIELAEKMGGWEYAKELKAQDKIRHLGFSFHGTPEELEGILAAHPETEFVQLQINYLDWEDPEYRAKEQYDICRRYNKPIVVMEPVRGGQLAAENSAFAKFFKELEPDSSVASWALRFVAEKPGLLTILSGMSAYDQVVDNVRTFEGLKPMTDEGRAAIKKSQETIAAIPRVPCTACRYCKDCPAGIPIPAMFDLYNDYLAYNVFNSHMYGFFSRGGKPSDCIGCKNCENECPQRIEIAALMGKIAAIAPK
ncbi:MAG: aldo/keto reductase [Oscillospiraceae bacterium]|nr:aldo/keto reductase [Oscillospiraceae bacterium]